MARGGITKSQGYLNRVFCVEYDAKGMIDAYGIEFMHELLDAIASNKVNCKQSVERWSAHVALNGITELSIDDLFVDHNDDDINELLDAVA